MTLLSLSESLAQRDGLSLRDAITRIASEHEDLVVRYFADMHSGGEQIAVELAAKMRRSEVTGARQLAHAAATLAQSRHISLTEAVRALGRERVDLVNAYNIA